jgi:hypothetical protein
MGHGGLQRHRSAFLPDGRKRFLALVRVIHLLVVPFRVTVQTDGSAEVSVGDLTLLPCPSGAPCRPGGQTQNRSAVRNPFRHE